MLENFEEIRNSIMSFVEMLDVNGLELNENGEIVEKGSKSLKLEYSYNEDDDE